MLPSDCYRQIIETLNWINDDFANNPFREQINHILNPDGGNDSGLCSNDSRRYALQFAGIDKAIGLSEPSVPAFIFAELDQVRTVHCDENASRWMQYDDIRQGLAIAIALISSAAPKPSKGLTLDDLLRFRSPELTDEEKRIESELGSKAAARWEQWIGERQDQYKKLVPNYRQSRAGFKKVCLELAAKTGIPVSAIMAMECLCRRTDRQAGQRLPIWQNRGGCRRRWAICGIAPQQGNPANEQQRIDDDN